VGLRLYLTTAFRYLKLRSLRNSIRNNADFLKITLEDVEEALVNHYHIRWSQIPVLDWESFSTLEAAEAAAELLARPGEKYTIEKRDEGCERCRDAAKSKAAPLVHESQEAP
jgi:hypothetical protein